MSYDSEVTHCFSPIRWDVSEEDFLQALNGMWMEAVAHEAVIPTPGPLNNAGIALVQKALHCEKCDSQCCKRDTSSAENHEGAGIHLNESEYHDIIAAYGREGTTKNQLGRCLTYPCRFLTDKGCSIYERRPVVCRLYPVEEGPRVGGWPVMGLNSSCPQAQWIMNDLFLVAYDMRLSEK